LGLLSSIFSARNARIAVGVGVGAAAGYAVGSFLGGVGSGLIGGIARADQFAGNSVMFPQELLENDHYIEFSSHQTTGRAEGGISELLNIGGIGSKTSGGTIRLPMPSNLSTDYNPEYSKPNLGPAAGMALKPSDQAIYGNNSMGGQSLAGNNLQGLTGSLGAAIAGAGVSAATTAIDGLASKIGGGAGASDALLKVAGGVAVNQHKIVLFTGVDFRTHQFSWKLSPKNRRESDAIKQIIEMFTYYSHPEYIAGGLFFKYPEFFEIKFRHPEYLFKLQPSVCTDIRVNYHGQGYAAYIRDANGGGIPAPAEVELSLTFMETEIVTKQSLNGVLKSQQSTPGTRSPLTGIGQNELRPDGNFNGILGTGAQTPTFDG
jgi:hypothetical protein